MDSLPSANLRQQKLEQQRQLIEQKQKQKRQQQVSNYNDAARALFMNENVIRLDCTASLLQGKMIQASDLRSGSAKSRGRPLSGKQRELYGYDGPMQYLNKGNPDDMTTVQVQE